MTPTSSTVLTDATFDEQVRTSATPILVDCWAEWCGPCKMLTPIVEDLARDWDGRMTVAMLDIDANPETARRYGVMSVPTLLLFADGELVHRSVGAKPKSRLAGELEPFLA